MKKTVWTFGLIAGAVMSAMMLINIPFAERIGFGTAEIIGYTTIVAAFLLIFFGIKSYRDNHAGKSISFGRAFVVGALINVIASACYVATWELIFYKLAPDFPDKYAAYVLEKERAAGATPQEIAKKQVQVQSFREMYQNPLVNAAITFLEPFTVGLVVSLASAGILRRRPHHHAGRVFSSGSSASCTGRSSLGTC